MATRGIGRVLVTGAAGSIGRVLRPAIAPRYRLRASDIVAVGALEQDEDEVLADLRVQAEVDAAMADVDVVVHLGGIANEHTWEMINAVNIGGTHAVLEAARTAGARRVILASSVHAVGFHPRSYRIGTDVMPRPDSFYGVSKVAGEGLGSLYAEKWGLEVACLRIASFQEQPRDRRHLSTWLSHGDMVRLVTACIEAPTLSPLSLSNFCVVNAISANTRRWMDESGWAHLGYVPVDDAERFAAEVEHLHGEEFDITERVQGGFFAAPTYKGLAD
jgi:uronate dehydrogenase